MQSWSEAQDKVAVPTLPIGATPLPLSVRQKAELDVYLALFHQQKMAMRLVDLKFKDVTLGEIVAHIKRTWPDTAATIEVRDARPLKVGFELKQIGVGDALDHIANLAGCQLYIRPGGLLIAPPSKLTALEQREFKQQRGGSWAHCADISGSGWSARSKATQLFKHAIIQDITRTDPAKLPAGRLDTSFGNFNPDSQNMLQEFARWSNSHSLTFSPTAPPIQLETSSVVQIDTTNPEITKILFPQD
ncbi:hypothetical protein EON83_27310 [bacterium]|nr:MAG: hypothetical protein EON83_27310 [bacterium]